MSEWLNSISSEITSKFRRTINHFDNDEIIEENVLFFFPRHLFYPDVENTLGYVKINTKEKEDRCDCFHDTRRIVKSETKGYIIVSQEHFIGSYFPEIQSLYLSDWTHTEEGAAFANKFIPKIMNQEWQDVSTVEEFPLDTTPTYNSSRESVSILDCVQTFYALDWAEMVLSRLDTSSIMLNKRLEILKNDVQAYTSNFNSLFASCIKDYLLLTSCGEARHALNICNKHSVMFKRTARNEVYGYITKYSQDQLTELLKRLFQLNWQDGYGGKKWYDIVAQVENYKKLSPKLYIDQSISIAHNGGYVYDKKVIFSCYDEQVFLDFLTFKRENLLNTGSPLIVDEQVHLLIKRLNVFTKEFELKTLKCSENLIDKMKKVAVKWGTMEVCPNLKREYETNLSYILAQTELSFLENAPIYEIMDGK